jgi:hypothetical protein
MPPFMLGFPRPAEPPDVPWAESRTTAQLVEVLELRMCKHRNHAIGVQLTSDPGGYPEVDQIMDPEQTQLLVGDIIAKCNGRPAAGAVRAPLHLYRRAFTTASPLTRRLPWSNLSLLFADPCRSHDQARRADELGGVATCSPCLPACPADDRR